jgi:hypothetical protein
MLLAVVWTIFINGGVQRVVAATGATESDWARLSEFELFCFSVN